MEATTTALDVLAEATSFIWDKFTAMAGDLLATPLFLVPVGIFVVGAAIGLVKRIIG